MNYLQINLLYFVVRLGCVGMHACKLNLFLFFVPFLPPFLRLPQLWVCQLETRVDEGRSNHEVSSRLRAFITNSVVYVFAKRKKKKKTNGEYMYTETFDLSTLFVFIAVYSD